MNVNTILTPITFLYFELLIYFFKLNKTGLSSWIYPMQRLKRASLIKKNPYPSEQVCSVTMQIYNKCISKAPEEAFYLLERFKID